LLLGFETFLFLLAALDSKFTLLAHHTFLDLYRILSFGAGLWTWGHLLLPSGLLCEVRLDRLGSSSCGRRMQIVPSEIARAPLSCRLKLTVPRH